MTCKDCLHGDVCVGYVPTDLDRDVWHYCREGKADQIPDIEERCSSFEDRTKYVEVVRCKDCKYTEDCLNRIQFWGRNPVLELNTTEYHPLSFCSYGEKREEASNGS